MSKLKRQPSPALVISMVSLFVALGSGAYAASKIDTKDIKKKAVTTPKIDGKAVKAGKIGGKAVTAPKLAPDSIKSTKIQDESLKTDDYGPGTVTGAKLATGAVDTDKIAGNAVTKEKVSSDIPYRRTLESTFTAGAGYLPLVSFGDAELQGRCRTAGANGFMELRVISPNNGAQADMTGTDPLGGQNNNSGLLGPNVGLELTSLLLGNFNSPGVGSVRVAARAPDGTPLVAIVGSHSLGGGDCVFNAMAL